MVVRSKNSNTGKIVNTVVEYAPGASKYVVEPFIAGAMLAFGQFFVRKVILHVMYSQNETATERIINGITGFFNKLIGK